MIGSHGRYYGVRKANPNTNNVFIQSVMMIAMTPVNVYGIRGTTNIDALAYPVNTSNERDLQFVQITSAKY